MNTNLDELIEAAMKVGARHSANDQAVVQSMHDLSVKLGANCDAGQEMLIDESSKAISAREDVNPKEGVNKYGSVAFADEKNKKYPIDTAAHIHSAWDYINVQENADKYSPDEVATIKRKIIAAWKDKIDKAGPPSAKSLDFSYAKSLGIAIPDLAVKSVAPNTIHGYTMIWGNPERVDVEREYFTHDTDFWDSAYGKSARPLTWDHAQDDSFKADPRIGTITDFGDDDIGRWYEATLSLSHRYRKAIDGMIEAGALGTSSDSVLQYIQRQKTKSGATWLAVWPWVGSALTTTPAEPRLLASVEYAKSIGFDFPFPEATELEQARQHEVEKARMKALDLFQYSRSKQNGN